MNEARNPNDGIVDELIPVGTDEELARFAERTMAESLRTRQETGKGARVTFPPEWYAREIAKGAKLYIEEGRLESDRVALMFGMEDGAVYVTILYGPSARHLELMADACRKIIEAGWGALPIRYRGAPSPDQLPLLNLIAQVCRATADSADKNLMTVENAVAALTLIEAEIKTRARL